MARSVRYGFSAHVRYNNGFSCTYETAMPSSGLAFSSL